MPPDCHGIIFDMDGTLVDSGLDFAAIRADLGIASKDGIIEAIEAMPPGDRERAEEILLSHELASARQAKLEPGAAEVVQAARDAGLKTALLTRNAREAMEIILGRFAALRFDLTWSRENGPIKPEPDGVLRACRELGISPANTFCVGDYHYDILAAKAAGAPSVLVARGDAPDYAPEADFLIASLEQLPQLLGF